MSFAYFFLAGSILLLVAALVLIRNRDPRLRSSGVALSVIAVLLLASAVVRLLGSFADGSEVRRLVDTITAANLSATSIVLIAWTVRLGGERR